MQTREEGEDIENEQYFNLTESQIIYLRNQAQRLIKEYSDRKRAIFRVEVSAAYNCHGLTFASRRTCIHSAQQVRRILAEDGYEKVLTLKEAMPGDVILYFSEGDAEHSGVVMKAQELMPWVLSKWGPMGPEVLHVANYCPYNCENLEYYRVVR